MSDDKKQSEKNKVDVLARDIGKRIFDARDGLGLSQESLYKRTKLNDHDGIGISRAVLSLYERGINKPGAREISILCVTLKISPNWLLFGSESPAEALLPSLTFLQGDDLSISIRVAFGILALSPVERNSLSSLLFSLLSKSLGDTRLSSLMMMANMMAPEFKNKILETVGNDAEKLDMKDLLAKFVEECAESVYTTYGNLRPLLSEEDFYNKDPDIHPPPRKL